MLKIVLPLLLIAIAFLLGRMSAGRAPTVPAGTFHAGMSIDRFVELSELLVVKVAVTDVVVTTLQGRAGGVQVVLLVKGDVSMGVDVTSAHFGEIDQIKRTAVLTMPPPTSSRPRLDHTKTRIVLLRKEGLWRLSVGSDPYAAATNRAMADAQGLVDSAGQTAEAYRRARTHAETVLGAFFRSIDWNVEIHWTDRGPLK
ncbi:MAG TPA: DUF4230 domain-containing protein [Roseimicrobium sp.]|nr:DUF4230 domain-containing protein [Roseimicrobium sp.]